MLIVNIYIFANIRTKMTVCAKTWAWKGTSQVGEGNWLQGMGKLGIRLSIISHDW